MPWFELRTKIACLYLSFFLSAACLIFLPKRNTGGKCHSTVSLRCRSLGIGQAHGLTTTSFPGLVRFVPAGDDTKILIGEPVDVSVDVGAAVRKGQNVEVKVFSGKSVLDPGSPTGETATIGRILSPLAQEEVGTIRCIGLNVSFPQSSLAPRRDGSIMGVRVSLLTGHFFFFFFCSTTVQETRRGSQDEHSGDPDPLPVSLCALASVPVRFTRLVHAAHSNIAAPLLAPRIKGNPPRASPTRGRRRPSSPSTRWRATRQTTSRSWRL